MKIILTLGLAFLAACAATPDAKEPAPPATGTLEVTVPPMATDLSVADAVDLALRRNPDLAMAAARIEAAEAAVAEAHSAFSPTLGVSVSYTHTNDPVLAFMQELRNRELTFAGDFNQPGFRGNFRASAEASWLVYDGGRRRTREELARLGVNLTRAEREAFLNGLKAAVIDTGIAVYEAEEFIRVATDSVHLVTEQRKAAEDRFDAGVVQRSDVLSVEVRLAAAREELVRARNAKERALTGLRTLLGLGAEEPFSLRPGGGFRVPPVEEQDLLGVARENRSELVRAEEGVAAAKKAVALAEAGDSATVAAFGSFDLDDEYAGFTTRQDSLTAGLRVDAPVLDGGRTEAGVAAARARLREARAARRKAELVVEADVTRARLELEEARERLSVSEKSEEQAKEALSLIRARYESGAATITEYLDAEVALTGARVRGVAARFDVERATADLRRALGICRAGSGGGISR